jgi:hypothetical protein
MTRGRKVNHTMTQPRKLVTGCAAVLIVLFAVACASQSTPDQTAAPEQTSQAPAQQAAPADQGTAPAAAPAEGTAAPAQGTAPAQQPPAQGDQPHN